MTSRGRGLLRKTFIYGLGVIGGKAIYFLLVPILTFCMSKGEVGRYDLILTSVALLCPILTLYIEQAVLRWLLDGKSESPDEVMYTAFATMLGNCLVFSVLYWVLFMWVEFQYKTLVYFLILCNAFFFYCQCVLRGTGNTGKSVLYVVLNLVNPLLFIALAFLSVFFLEMGIEGILLSQVLATCASILVFVLSTHFISRFSLALFDRGLNRSLLQYSIPLLPNYFSWWGITSANKYLVFYILGAEAVGIYAVAQRLAGVFLMINAAFYAAWTEESIIHYEKEDRDSYFSNIFNTYATLFLTAIILAISVLKPSLTLLIDSDFYEVWKYVPILCLGVAFNAFAGFLGTIYLCSKETVGVLKTSLIGLLVTVIFGAGLIGPFKLYGVAAAMLAGNVTVFVARLLYIRKSMDFKMDNPRFLLLTCLTFLSYGLILLDQAWIDFCLIGGAIALFVTYNQNTMRRVLKGRIR